MKKLIALVLALALVALVGIASANTITIESNAPAGATNTTTYTWYKILELDKASTTTLTAPDEDTGELSDAAASPVSYYVESETLANLLDATTYLTATASADGTRWNITKTGNPTGAQLAATLNTDDIKTNAIAHDTVTASGNSNVVINNLTDGYYLIVASNGTALIAQSLGDVTIKEKNTYITDVKTVEEADLAVGETAHFHITIHVPATAVVGETITVHDTMDNELTYNNDVTAVLGSTSVTLTDHDPADVSSTNGKTAIFTKDFVITADMLNQNVVLSYTATVNEDADPDTDGFVNQSFANDSNFETLPSRVRVYTFDFNLDKTFVGVAPGTEGNYSATFNLKKGSTVLKFVKDGAEYVLALDQSSSSASADLVVTGADAINIRGLDAGDYELVETATAAGFNKLTESINVKIVDDTATDDKNNPNVTPTYHVEYKMHSAANYTSVNNLTVPVDNNAGTQLPSTGGIGTTIFYILGGLLVVGAAVILVARRKASN